MTTKRLRRAGEMLRSAAGRVWAMVVMLLSLPADGLRYLLGQLRGTWRNIGRAWNYLTFDNILPPSIVGLIQWVIDTTPKFLGLRGWKPWHQIGAAITVLIVAIFSTVLSGGLLIGAVIFAAVLLLTGVVRLVPAANDSWNETTAAIGLSDDYDVPRWKRD